MLDPTPLHTTPNPSPPENRTGPTGSLRVGGVRFGLGVTAEDVVEVTVGAPEAVGVAWGAAAREDAMAELMAGACGLTVVAEEHAALARQSGSTARQPMNSALVGTGIAESPVAAALTDPVLLLPQNSTIFRQRCLSEASPKPAQESLVIALQAAQDAGEGDCWAERLICPQRVGGRDSSKSP